MIFDLIQMMIIHLLRIGRYTLEEFFLTIKAALGDYLYTKGQQKYYTMLFSLYYTRHSFYFQKFWKVLKHQIFNGCQFQEYLLFILLPQGLL